MSLLNFRCVNGHMECRVCFDMTPQCGKCKGKIVDVIEDGYMIGEKILRFGKVVIGS